MKIKWSKVFNILIMLLVLVILAGFQGTFWYQLFGAVPAPMLWLCVLVYVALYRKLYPAVFTIYIMALALTGFTVMPLKMLLVCFLLVYLILYSIRSRVFWEGPAYFTIMCTLAAFSFHFIYFFGSWILERNSAPISFWDRTLQVLLTPAIGVPMYWLLTKIDKMTRNDLSLEPGGLDL